MAELHTLQVHTNKYKPNQAIIKALRGMLKEAKEGKIQGLAAAYCIVDEEYEEGRAVVSTYPYTPGWYHTLQHGITSLFFRANNIETVGIKAPDLTDEDE